MTKQAFIYDAIRTPRGKAKNGSLAAIKPVDLVVGLIKEISHRFPQLPSTMIEDLILGVATPVGDQGADIARTAIINSVLPESIPGLQVNRFCASGLEAINLAAQKIISGWGNLVLAGGVESMSRVPMGSDGSTMYLDPLTNYNSYFIPQGISADLIATLEHFSREELDRFAVESQKRAAQAWDKGYFNRSVVPVTDMNGITVLDNDDFLRPDTTLEKLHELKPAFDLIGKFGGFDAVALQKFYDIEKINHLHTGGNSSGIVDGAALTLIGSIEIGKQLGIAPRARIVASAVVGTDPTLMLTGPTPATKLVLEKAKLKTEDIDVWEVNEAFAAIVLKFLRDMHLDSSQVNTNGGAIALGHPLGATGAILMGTALDELERINGKYALITLCIAGGMGISTIIEKI